MAKKVISLRYERYDNNLLLLHYNSDKFKRHDVYELEVGANICINGIEYIVKVIEKEVLLSQGEVEDFFEIYNSENSYYLYKYKLVEV